jgi:undecaprenyl-diphosphatase
MNFFHAAILGLVEGVTEFLPISSTGHLILAAKLLGLKQTEFLKSFEIAIQLGAILAVVVLYAKRFIMRLDVLLKVGTAFLPTAILGAMLYKLIKKYLMAGETLVLWTLLLGGIFLIVFEKFHKEPQREGQDFSEISYAKAFWIGVCQSVAMIPGVSRAAATIVGGLGMGISRKTIVEFSFLLAVPTMAAATALDLLKTGSSFSADQSMVLASGFLVSFAVAILVIRLLLRFIQNHNFVLFGWYRILVAGVLFFVLK